MKRDAGAAAPPRPTVVAVLGLVSISLGRNSSGDNH